MVQYTPEAAGEHTEELIIETAFQTRMKYKLKGTGCTLNLEATALDAMVLDFKKSPLSVIYFDVTMPRAVTSRKLKVKNHCGMKVMYHWSIYKNKITDKISLSGEETHFIVEPLQGSFNGYEEQEFIITFKPIHALSYFEYADLIVDDIPIQAVPDAPESLKALLGSNNAGPSYLGSNTRYPSFPYLGFTLEGYGDSYEIIPDPPIIIFPSDITIFKEHSRKFKLINKSKSAINVKISLKGKTSDDFSVRLISPSLPLKDDVYSGILDKPEEEIEVQIESETVGEHKAYFVGTIEDGNPFTFEVIGQFTGPRVKVHEKSIEFGLIKTYTKSEFTLNVENLTEIEAEVLVKMVRNRALTFYSVNNEPMLDLKENPDTSDREIPEDNKAKIIINPEYLKLQPFEKSTIQVKLEAAEIEMIKDYLEIDTKYHEPQYLSMHAEVQKPCLTLSQSVIDLGVTYAGLNYKIDENHKYALWLNNIGNLDASFAVIYINN